MNRFAELLDRLAYEPGRNNKLRLITAYFRQTEDPDRGYALAALTGALSFRHAKPGLIRDLIAARTDPVLFALSYDYVGDLSETAALMWPRAAREVSLLGGDDGHDDQPLQKDPPPPTPPPHRSRHHAAHARQDRAAEAAHALARRSGRDRPLGAVKTRHRRDADRHLGTPRQDGGRGTWRQGSARYRTDVAGTHPALPRSVRVAGRPRGKTG